MWRGRHPRALSQRVASLGVLGQVAGINSQSIFLVVSFVQLRENWGDRAFGDCEQDEQATTATASDTVVVTEFGCIEALDVVILAGSLLPDHLATGRSGRVGRGTQIWGAHRVGT